MFPLGLPPPVLEQYCAKEQGVPPESDNAELSFPYGLEPLKHHVWASVPRVASLHGVNVER